MLQTVMAMVTIMVANEFGENVPVGWCLSNCEDGQLFLVTSSMQSRRKLV